MALPAKTQKGRFAKLYIDSSPESETPTWVEIDLVRDGRWAITPALESTTVRKHGRGNRQESFGYDFDASCDLRLPEKSGSVAYYSQLRNGAKDGASIHLLLGEGPRDGDGFELIDGWFEVSTFEKTQPIDGHTVFNLAFVQGPGPDLSFSLSTTGGGGD